MIGGTADGVVQTLGMIHVLSVSVWNARGRRKGRTVLLCAERVSRDDCALTRRCECRARMMNSPCMRPCRHAITMSRLLSQNGAARSLAVCLAIGTDAAQVARKSTARFYELVVHAAWGSLSTRIGRRLSAPDVNDAPTLLAQLRSLWSGNSCSFPNVEPALLGELHQCNRKDRWRRSFRAE